MKMEDWHSEWVDCPNDISLDSKHFFDLSTTCLNEDISEESEFIPDLTAKENSTDSPTFSRDSTESFYDEFSSKSDKIEESLLKTSLINASLAKKRLQAYSKQIKKSPTKEERLDVEDKRLKKPTKKAKKGLYPDEKAKTVIQEIEEIKRKEFEDLTKRLSAANAIKSMNADIFHQHSQTPDRHQQFKRREIKQRNYRRTDSSTRRSASPEDNKSRGRSSPTPKCPKDWLEFKNQNLTIPKDKFKSVPKKGLVTLGLLEKLYNFDLPSPPIEPFKFATENGTREISASYLKVTRSRPPLMYSVNSEKLKDSFLSRDQLFELVSNERQQAIKDVFSKHSKFVPYSKKIQSQLWYNKQWKKASVPDCKVLENSVGLSFLQNYSDEDDDNETEEILICSTIKKNKTEVATKNSDELQLHTYKDPIETNLTTTDQYQDVDIKDANYEKDSSGYMPKTNNKSEDEVAILTPDRDQSVSISQTNNKSEDETGILTPEIPPLQLFKIQKTESNHSDFTQQKLEEKQIDVQEKNSKHIKPSDSKKKRRKAKRKMDSSNLDQESPKKKKKKKTKPAKSNCADQSENTEEESRKTKKQKKVKNKEKLRKKTKNSKGVASEIKLKKKVDLCEQLNLKKTRAKKKKKQSGSLEIKSPLIDDLRKKSKKKNKKKKREQALIENDLDGEKKLTNKKEAPSEKSSRQKSVEHADISETSAKLNRIDSKHKVKDKHDVEKEISSQVESVKRLKNKRRKIKREIEVDRRMQQMEKNEEDTVDETVYKEKKDQAAEMCKEKKGQTVVDALIKDKPVDAVSVEVDPAKEEEPNIQTPDTDEYKGHWEKDADPLWESEDDNISKQKSKLNSSWESDDELFETAGRPSETKSFETSRTNNEVLDLEIPLNIKPFKKRKVLDANSEFELLKIQRENLNSERLKLEIEKLKVRKLQLLAVAEKHQSAAKESKKIRRWDKKELIIPKTKKESLPTSDTSLTTTVLENEYEEFMKAVSSNTNSSPNGQVNASIISVSSTDSKNSVADDTVPEKSAKIEDKVDPLQIFISPKDIPFIPMPDEIKLQPVASTPIKNVSKTSTNLNGSTNNLNQSNIEQSSVSESEEKADFDNSAVTTSQAIKDLETRDSVKKSFSFTTLLLPSKKPLLDNSNLKLGDSDDEKAMKPIEEIRKEFVINSSVEQTEDLMEQFNESKFNDLEQENTPSAKDHLRTKQRSPDRRHDDKPKKIEASPRRESQSVRHRRRGSSPRRRDYSPKREVSPRRRRRKSPEKYRDKSRTSPSSRRCSSRRSYSPSHRRRTPSPRRKSPKRSVSPRDRPYKKTSRTRDKSEGMITETPRQTSSPLEGLKRSLADSTISDDSLLPQPSLDEYTQSPLPHYFDRMKPNEQKRISLDDRIHLELGFHKQDFKQISATYDNFCHSRYSESPQFCTPMKNQIMDKNEYTSTDMSSNFVQIGNMVEIVPTDLDLKTDIHLEHFRHEHKSQIVQVGNVLQIVPTELSPEIPLPPLPPASPKNVDSEIKSSIVTPEKQSAETAMKQKIAERREEREKRRRDREARRKEKENRRREKEKQRQVKMKQKTDNMIKRALQLEVESQEGGDSAGDDMSTQWPPRLNVSDSSQELINKSILVRGRRRSSKLKRKVVQFADGIKPGEGTSPSAGEELSSPLPCRVLPKEKRYTKTKLRMKNVKKKVKVKIIKSTEPELEESEEEDILPPPSPPPGSPPPHIFPPRVKLQVNTLSYVSSVVNKTQAIYRPPVNVLMMSQALTHPGSLQQLHVTGEQQPPLPDSPMQVHSYSQYQVPPLPSVPPPPPQGATESSIGNVHRNHRFNYPL